ncbi:MAG: hypothetical protein PWP37_1634 [Thermotogota bacterium]|nr:hypothetical protein [Thermotogota bacterium]MDK2865442.1 hypothetical protein [Thermotogota bacterium]
MRAGTILRHILTVAFIIITTGIYAQHFADSWDAIPYVALRYDGPEAVRSLFEDVIDEFFIISKDATNSATLTVRKTEDLFAFSLEIDDDLIASAYVPLPIEEALKTLETSIEKRFQRKPKGLTITLIPLECQIQLGDSMISTTTSISWKRREPLLYRIITDKSAATETYIPLNLPTQVLEVHPEYYFFLVDTHDVEAFLDGVPVNGMLEVVGGFHKLEVKDGTELLFEGDIYISSNTILSQLIGTLELQKKEGRMIFDVGSEPKLFVGSDLLRIPENTKAVIESGNKLFFVLGSSIVDEDGQEIFNVPLTLVFPEANLVFLSDGTVWNYERDWKKTLPNPVLACAETNNGEVYMLTTSGGIYRLNPHRGTLSFVKQTQAYWTGVFNDRLVVIDHEGVKTVEGSLLKKTEFPVKSAVSTGSRIFLLLSVGILEVFPDGKRWFVGDGNLFQVDGRVYFVSRAHDFLMIINENLEEEYIRLCGQITFSGVVSDTFQIISGGKLHVFK